MTWLDTLLGLRAAGERAVAVTVAATRGSVPRDAGTKMIVTAGAVHGTIGGGHLEHQAIAIARELVASGGPQALRRFPLGASLGQCCGGLVNLLFEPIADAPPWLDWLTELRARRAPGVIVTTVDGAGAAGKLVVAVDAVSGTLGAALDPVVIAAARAMLAGDESARLARVGEGDDARTLLYERLPADELRIVLFGAGHVGRALVRILGDLPCRVTWVDERADEFPGDVPANVTVVCTNAPEEEVAAAPPRAYYLVMTHNHALDERLTEQILRRDDVAWFGLIGSLTKRRQFERRLTHRGMPAERLAAMICPIGVPGIPGKEPGAIAVAVAAQLLTEQARAAVAERASSRSATS